MLHAAEVAGVAPAAEELQRLALADISRPADASTGVAVSEPFNDVRIHDVGRAVRAPDPRENRPYRKSLDRAPTESPLIVPLRTAS